MIPAPEIPQETIDAAAKRMREHCERMMVGADTPEGCLRIVCRQLNAALDEAEFLLLLRSRGGY